MPRIVDWDEFKTMQPGTVYWEYQPEIFYNPAVLRNFIEYDGEIRDFVYTSIVPWRALPEDELEICCSSGRWGVYDYDQLFCVLDEDDVKDLITTLMGGG